MGVCLLIRHAVASVGGCARSVDRGKEACSDVLSIEGIALAIVRKVRAPAGQCLCLWEYVMMRYVLMVVACGGLLCANGYGADTTVAVDHSGTIEAATTSDTAVVPGDTLKVGGASGVLLKQSSGDVQVRTSGDSGYADLAADILNAVTKVQVNGTDMLTSAGVADGMVSAAAMGFARTIVLEPGDNLIAAYEAAEAMSPSAAAGNPIAIVLSPGVYELTDPNDPNTPATLAMDTAYINLIGSGRDVSIVQTEARNSSVIVQSADNVVIAALTMEHAYVQCQECPSNVGPVFTQTSAVSTDSLMYDCGICATSTPASGCVGIDNFYGRGEFLDIRADDWAIANIRSDAILRHSTVEVTGSAPDIVYGIASGAVVEYCSFLRSSGSWGIDHIETGAVLRSCYADKRVNLRVGASPTLIDCVVPDEFWMEGSNNPTLIGGRYADVGGGTNCTLTAGGGVAIPLDGVITGITWLDPYYVHLDDPNTVSTGMVKDDAVTSAKIADSAVGTAHLSSNAVTEAKIGTGEVTLRHVSGTIDDYLTNVLDFSASPESSDTITVTVDVMSRNDDGVAGRYLVNVWLSDAQYGGLTSDGSATMSVSTGTVKQTLTANKDVIVVTNSSGWFEVEVSRTGAATFYLNAEVNGEVSASSALMFE